MATEEKRLVALPEAELKELLELTSAADSVELKLTIPESDQRSTVHALGMDPLEGQIRQVFFFDTPELALNDAGIVTRARRIQDKPHDSVVKLRPVVPAELPEGVRSSSGMTVEVDAMPGGYVCSAALKHKVGSDDVKAAVDGSLPVHKLFSKKQRAFYEEHAPEGVALDDLAVLGPIFVLKLKLWPGDLGRKLVAELWLYPDGKRILELSTRCASSEMFQVAAESRVYLGERGIDLTGEQQTKTKTALEFFASELGG